MTRSYVVTGGGRDIGRAITERLLDDGHAVVVIEFDSATLEWAQRHAAGSRIATVVGSAADEAVTERAADLAQAAGDFAGWINNAAVFRDAAAYLLSDEASFINGAVLPVDGGRSALGLDPEEA